MDFERGYQVRVGLWDVDSRIPNLALMKLSAFHKARGDEIAFPWRGEMVDQLYASVVFSWSRRRLESGIPRDAIIGGSGWDYTVTLSPDVEAMRPDYGLYGIDYGLGFMFRGCSRHCKFCVVPRKEGRIRRVGRLDDIVNPLRSRRQRVVLLDNNLLAADDALSVLREIADRRLEVNFSQGLDIRLVTPEIAAALANIRFWNLHFTKRQLHFAWDSPGIERHVRKGVEILHAAGIKPYRLAFYVLVGFNTSFEEDMHRVTVLREMGCDPFVMIYRGDDVEAHNSRLRHFARWVNRRLYKSCSWGDYRPQRLARSQLDLFAEECEGMCNV